MSCCPTLPFEAQANGVQLGQCRKGWRGRVVAFAPADRPGMPWHEMERRLLEMGFIEGAKIEVLHDGPICHDPIAVRVDDTTVALRRRDAAVIMVAATEAP